MFYGRIKYVANRRKWFCWPQNLKFTAAYKTGGPNDNYNNNDDDNNNNNNNINNNNKNNNNSKKLFIPNLVEKSR